LCRPRCPLPRCSTASSPQSGQGLARVASPSRSAAEPGCQPSPERSPGAQQAVTPLTPSHSSPTQALRDSLALSQLCHSPPQRGCPRISSQTARASALATLCLLFTQQLHNPLTLQLRTQLSSASEHCGNLPAVEWRGNLSYIWKKKKRKRSTFK